MVGGIPRAGGRTGFHPVLSSHPARVSVLISKVRARLSAEHPSPPGDTGGPFETQDDDDHLWLVRLPDDVA